MSFSLLTILAALVDTPPGPVNAPDDLQKPVVAWSGRYPAAEALELPGTLKTEVIGTDAAWAKFWKGRRGDEVAPRVDFGQAVVVVVTWPGMAADSVSLGQRGRHRHAAWVGAWEGRINGVGYVAGVFPRAGIRDVEGLPLPR
jgi:hypothetical protein